MVARSGMNNPQQTALYVYRPGGFQPLNLGNPVAGLSLLDCPDSGTRNIVYGLSTQTVYGLEELRSTFTRWHG